MNMNAYDWQDREMKEQTLRIKTQQMIDSMNANNVQKLYSSISDVSDALQVHDNIYGNGLISTTSNKKPDLQVMGGSGGGGRPVYMNGMQVIQQHNPTIDIEHVTLGHKLFGSDVIAVAVQFDQGSKQPLKEQLWICRIGSENDWDDSQFDTIQRIAKEGHQIREWEIATAMFPELDPQLFTS